MSQDFVDPELFADFIVESKEHLETIEPNLLELEKAPDNLALLNEIFRPMHSLKGASGFLNLNRINRLAHKSESILDELRKGAMVVTPEIMDVILLSTDALRQMVDNLEQTSAEGDVAIEPVMEMIDAIMRGEVVNTGGAAPAPQPQSAPATLQPEPEAVVAETAPQPLESASVTQPSAPASSSSAGRLSRSNPMLAKEWILSQPRKETATLTAFGEAHLKDFMDEARENTENLSNGLLDLERQPEGNSNLVNDLFRYFHNLKGNSGIIDFQELNGLTHEAETLLNRVRHEELAVTHELVDLLLFVVDALEALVDCIDPHAGNATPLDCSSVLAQLKQAVAGGPIALPPAFIEYAASEEAAGEQIAEAPSEAASASAAPVAPAAEPPLEAAGADRDQDDLDMFLTTVRQQQRIMSLALEALNKDSAQLDQGDALFRCLSAIQKAAGFMGFEELKVYAERTANLVDGSRKSVDDMSIMLSILEQEIAIINDMVTALGTRPVEAAPAAPVAAATPVAPPAPQPPVATPAPKAPEAPKPVQAPVASAPAAPAAVPAPKAPEAPKPAAPKPAAEASKPAAEAAKAAAAAPAEGGGKTSSTIRVDHEKLDHLMNLIGELIINRNRYAMIGKQMEEQGQTVDVPLMAQHLNETTYAMARISNDLQDTIMKVRMVPVSSVFSRFPRLVRDLSRKSGKEVDLIMEGEDTELDKSVVEVIGDPLVHLIRNSVDHGIESEEARIAAGKNPKGKVTLRAFHQGNSVAIEVEDDGAGIDPEKMREVAIRKGVISAEEAKNLDDREAIDLIFAPGFSSADKVTDISGRGVGMDVVRTNIKNLKGSVSTSTQLGKGTCFTLSLPLTLAIIDALMVTLGQQTFAIPLDAVSTTTKLESVRLTDVKGRKAVTLRGEVLGIVELAEILNMPRKAELPPELSVVIIQNSDRRLGLVVDRLLERQEIVIKPLGAYLNDLKGISGATIMGDGSVILILDPHEIYTMATSRAG